MNLFQRPEWVNWTKWRRRGWLALMVSALVGGASAVHWLIKNVLIPNWPW